MHDALSVALLAVRVKRNRRDHKVIRIYPIWLLVESVVTPVLIRQDIGVSVYLIPLISPLILSLIWLNSLIHPLIWGLIWLHYSLIAAPLVGLILMSGLIALVGPLIGLLIWILSLLIGNEALILVVAPLVGLLVALLLSLSLSPHVV